MQNNLTLKRKRVMTYFIEATEKLIREDSIDGLSIRKIAVKAGYNSATLYNYFEDLEHLILFASVRYLREYISALAANILPKMNALEKYHTIYSTFNYFAFRSPEIFYNMFFGKYSPKLSQVIFHYYQLFPDDLQEHSSELKAMLIEGTMYARDEAIMKELVSEKFVKPEKTKITIDILVRTQQSYLYEVLMKGKRVDLDKQSEMFLDIFDYVMKMAK